MGLDVRSINDEIYSLGLPLRVHAIPEGLNTPQMVVDKGAFHMVTYNYHIVFEKINSFIQDGRMNWGVR